MQRDRSASGLFGYFCEEEEEDMPVVAVPITNQDRVILQQQQPSPPSTGGSVNGTEDTPPPLPPKPARGHARPQLPPRVMPAVSPQPRFPARHVSMRVPTATATAAAQINRDNPTPPPPRPSSTEMTHPPAMTAEDVRLIARFMQADGRGAEARALLRMLPVQLDDPYRPIDPEVDILLGYRPVPVDSAGLSNYDFFEELGSGYYFYSHRETAWRIGRQTDWGSFRVVRGYIKPPYRRGYEDREKVRVYPDEAWHPAGQTPPPPQQQQQQQQASHPVGRSRSGFFSLSRRLLSAVQQQYQVEPPKYKFDSIVHSAYGREIMVADAPIGYGTQLKLGAGYENQIVIFNDASLSLEEMEIPEGGWPIAMHPTTRSHGRLRAMVQRAVTQPSSTPAMVV